MLKEVTEEINSELHAGPFEEHEILIIDDGSTDGTGEIADHLAAECPTIRSIHHDQNRGLGEVYRTGFYHARHELITFYPADGQFPISILKTFVPLMKDFDLVLGYFPRGRRRLWEQLLSTAERTLYRSLFGKLPRFQGVFLLRRNILNKLELRSSGRSWTILMELVIRMLRGGYRITSVPTEFRARVSGRSKVNNLQTIFAHLKDIWILRRHL